MPYLDFDRLESFDVAAFRRAKPYPWANPQGLLAPEGFEALCRDFPELSLFERHFDRERKAGQQPHDRYTLEYRDGLSLADSWRDFAAELRSERYRRAMQRLLGCSRIRMRLFWNYTPSGCSVSPHSDAVRRAGTHIFYFHAHRDWNPDWGGETLILDDGGRFQPRSAPEFEDFDGEERAEMLDNRSLFFANGAHAWHGVREIRCPADRFRRTFFAIFYRDTLYFRVRDAIKGKKQPSY